MGQKGSKIDTKQGQNGTKEAQLGPKMIEVGQKWIKIRGKMDIQRGQEGARDAQVGPKSGQKKRDPEFYDFLTNLGGLFWGRFGVWAVF